MNTQDGNPSSPGAAGPVLDITRHFDALPAEVYAAWTLKEHADRWFAPKDFTLPWSEAEVRPGGRKACMTSPAGENHIAGGEYRVVEAGRRLVFTHIWEEKDGPGRETTVEVEFTPEDGGTRMIFHQGVFESDASRDSHRDGWNECFDKLDACLRTGAVAV